MASVFETILEKINTAAFFVFPSEITAEQWARKICLYGGQRSLSPGRFLAWDRFKEEAIRPREKKLRPVSSLIRQLFALSITRKNAESPFLGEIIPPEFSGDSSIFADYIAGILSSLERWETLHEAQHIRDDGEDRDLRVIKTQYWEFLQANSLFEPSASVEKTTFQKNENRYIIFFPEVLEDFNEYKKLLGVPEVEFYSCNAAAECTAKMPKLYFYDSSPLEIRSAILEIQRLRKEGLLYEEIAITMPDYNNMAPYVMRELGLHDIPCKNRRGNTLGEYPIGKLFSLVRECSASQFSFDAVKRLLLDNSIPWRNAEKNRALITYGIQNHCAAPFSNRSYTVDPWEEGFKQNPDTSLESYYLELKKAILALTGAKSFAKILAQYHIFRSFLDMEKCSGESDAVLARCIEELSVLIEAEENYPALACTAPYDFYLSHLKKKNYVFTGKGGGVNLYDYPVAAGAPFGCHIVLNATQAASGVHCTPLPFLRPDKRLRLGITDTDMSAAMLSLFAIAPYGDYTCHTRISASERTYAGWAIPHNFFAQNQINAHAENDRFAEELKWRHDQSLENKKIPASLKPAELHSVQKEGFRNWSKILLQAEKGDPGNPCTGNAAGVLLEAIHRKNENNTSGNTAELSVSASDLNDFFKCPVLWLYNRVFHLKKYALDATLLDAESLGLIYHKILERLYKRIKQNGGSFKKENLDTYFEWLEEISVSVLHGNDALRGSLVYPLLPPLAAAINRKLRAYLKTDAEYFDGYLVKELEQGYKVIQGKILLNGYIDRVSEGGSGPVIIDYKAGEVPLKSHCRIDEDGKLKNFQIPMYIKLFEETTGEKADSALFAGIQNNEFITVIGCFGNKDFSRGDYQSSMDALDRAIEDFSSAVLSLRFSRLDTPWKTCSSCRYRIICRTQYFLNPPKDRCCIKTQDSWEEEDE